MNISITPELEKFVQSKVDSGMYSSASEVIREALRLLSENDFLRQQRILKLNEEIKKGLDDVAAGRIISSEEVEKRIVQRRKAFLKQNPQ